MPKESRTYRRKRDKVLKMWRNRGMGRGSWRGTQRISVENLLPLGVSTPEDVLRMEQQVLEERDRLTAFLSSPGPSHHLSAIREESDIGSTVKDTVGDGACPLGMTQEEWDSQEAERKLAELVDQSQEMVFPSQDVRDRPDFDAIELPPRRNLQAIRAGRYFGGLKIISTNPHLDPPYGSCFNCWDQTHQVRMCPRPRNRLYRNCGRRNLVLEYCPRCGDKYRDRIGKGLEKPSGDSSRVVTLPTSVATPRLMLKTAPADFPFDQVSLEQDSEVSHPSIQSVEHPEVPTGSSGNVLQELKELDQLLQGLPPEVVRETKL